MPLICMLELRGLYFYSQFTKKKFLQKQKAFLEAKRSDKHKWEIKV